MAPLCTVAGPVEPAAPEGTTPGWQDPFHIPDDLTKPGHGEGMPGWQDPFQGPHALGRIGPVPADAGPLDPANNEVAWAKNRRCEFKVAG